MLVQRESLTGWDSVQLHITLIKSDVEQMTRADLMSTLAQRYRVRIPKLKSEQTIDFVHSMSCQKQQSRAAGEDISL